MELAAHELKEIKQELKKREGTLWMALRPRQVAMLLDEIECLRAELATMKAVAAPANEAPAVEVEPDYEAYRAAQEKAHWDMLDQMEDARELDEYFEEHGVEPGGICPDCGRTDAGCSCERI